jgi:hypothetical protein
MLGSRGFLYGYGLWEAAMLWGGLTGVKLVMLIVDLDKFCFYVRM